ncbi:hypothetical protein JCM19233_5973 [Vibrio astriarenae]|nr:hypothetical protein JCM19233_5973 [Vibrio sp. C7]
MSDAQARALVQPFYTYLSNPLDEQAAANARSVFSQDWRSHDNNDSSKGLDETIKAVNGYGQLIPNLKWEIKDVKVAGDTIVVRGEASGTPKGEFFGVPETGNSFKIMSIDLHTVEDGKVVKSYHIENWVSAIGQLTAE